MKKYAFYLFIPMAVWAGCKNAAKEAPLPEKPATRPVVYVSNYPLHYFASRIGGEHVDLHFPGSALADPADWTPPADTVAAMQQADLILLNGAGLEGWLMNVSLPDSLLTDTSAAYTNRLLASGESFTHSHGAEGEHAHQGTAHTTWLDLTLAREQAAAVRDALTRIRPSDTEIFDANYQALATDLTELETAYRQVTRDASGAHVAYSHPVYAYFQQAYGLQGPSLHWEPDAPLDPESLHELSHLKEDRQIRYLIWERTPLEGSAQQLEEQEITSLVVEVMAGAPETGDFLDGLRRNLEALRQIGGNQP